MEEETVNGKVEVAPKINWQDVDEEDKSVHADGYFTPNEDPVIKSDGKAELVKEIQGGDSASSDDTSGSSDEEEDSVDTQKLGSQEEDEDHKSVQINGGLAQNGHSEIYPDEKSELPKEAHDGDSGSSSGNSRSDEEDASVEEMDSIEDDEVYKSMEINVDFIQNGDSVNYPDEKSELSKENQIGESDSSSGEEASVKALRKMDSQEKDEVYKSMVINGDFVHNGDSGNNPDEKSELSKTTQDGKSGYSSGYSSSGEEEASLEVTPVKDSQEEDGDHRSIQIDGDFTQNADSVIKSDEKSELSKDTHNGESGVSDGEEEASVKLTQKMEPQQEDGDHKSIRIDGDFIQSGDSVNNFDEKSHILRETNDGAPAITSNFSNGQDEALVAEVDKVSSDDSVKPVVEELTMVLESDSPVENSELGLAMPDGEIPVENSVISDVVAEMGSKENEDELVKSLDEEIGFSPAEQELVLKGIKEVEFPPLDGKTGESSTVTYIATNDNVNNKLQPSNATDEQRNKAETPEIAGNPPIISVTSRTMRPTSWRSCCGLFDVLRRSER